MKRHSEIALASCVAAVGAMGAATSAVANASEIAQQLKRNLLHLTTSGRAGNPPLDQRVAQFEQVAIEALARAQEAQRLAEVARQVADRALRLADEIETVLLPPRSAG